MSEWVALSNYSLHQPWSYPAFSRLNLRLILVFTFSPWPWCRPHLASSCHVHFLDASIGRSPILDGAWRSRGKMPLDIVAVHIIIRAKGFNQHNLSTDKRGLIESLGNQVFKARLSNRLPNVVCKVAKRSSKDYSKPPDTRALQPRRICCTSSQSLSPK